MMAAKGKVIPMEPRKPVARASTAQELAFEDSVALRGAGVAGAPVRVKSRRRDVTTSRSETGTGTINNPRRRADGVKTRATTVHLPVELARRLVMYAAEKGIRQSEVVAEAVRAHLGKS